MRMIAEFEKMGRMSWFFPPGSAKTPCSARCGPSAGGLFARIQSPCADLVCHGAVRRLPEPREVMEVEMAGEISRKNCRKAQRLFAGRAESPPLRIGADSAPALMAKGAEADTT